MWIKKIYYNRYSPSPAAEGICCKLFMDHSDNSAKGRRNFNYLKIILEISICFERIPDYSEIFIMQTY